jgi:hypothetical protein
MEVKTMLSITELEAKVRDMVAYDILSKPLSSLGQKAGRRRDKLAGETAKLLREGEEFERVTAYVRRTEEEKARTLREGIDAFSEAHPKYGSILEEMIQEKRTRSNRHLYYAITPGFNLGATDYRSVMRDLGLSPIEADAMYPHLMQLSERLGQAGEQSLRSILL